MRPHRLAALAAVTAFTYGISPVPAAAFNPLKPVCKVAGIANPAAGHACKTVAGSAGSLARAGTQLGTGQVGGAVSTLVDGGAALGLSAIGAWVLTGASFALHETVKLIGQTTAPQLSRTWFSSTYWRTAGIAGVLTVPFLFAAVIQALLRSDLALVARAAFGYLPLAMLAVGIAAPLTMLLLAASDQMSSVVSAAAGNSGSRYLARAALTLGALTPLPEGAFLAFLVGLFTAAAAVVLWFELLMREAAVYVIVLMLPLAFAAMVWPARRIWAIRAVELLVALVFSKFVIVAVLSLGGAALNGGLGDGVAGWLAGLVILATGAFAPWAMLRLVPLAEVASNAVSSLRGQGRLGQARVAVDSAAHSASEWAATTTALMRRELEAVRAGGSDAGPDGAKGAAVAAAAGLGAGQGFDADPPPNSADPPPNSADPPPNSADAPRNGAGEQSGRAASRTGADGQEQASSPAGAREPNPSAPHERPAPGVGRGASPGPPSRLEDPWEAASRSLGTLDLVERTTPLRFPGDPRNSEAQAPEHPMPLPDEVSDDSDPLPPAQDPADGVL